MTRNRPFTLWARMRDFLSWHRRLVAAALAAGSVACALMALQPPAPDRIDVLAAATDLPGGTNLSPTDLTTVALRPEAVPQGALRPGADVNGRVLAGPMREGEPLTDARLTGAAQLVGDESVATPVRIADDGVARFLHAGDRIDILAAATRGDALGDPAEVVASGVRVVAVPRSEKRSGGVGIGQGALIIVATSSEDAAELASAAVTSRLTATLGSGQS